MLNIYIYNQTQRIYILELAILDMWNVFEMVNFMLLHRQIWNEYNKWRSIRIPVNVCNNSLYI